MRRNRQSNRRKRHFVLEELAVDVQHFGGVGIEHHDGGLADQPQFPDQVVQREGVCVGVLGHDFLVVAVRGGAFTAGKQDRPKTPDAFPVNEVLEDGVDGPFALGVGSQADAPELFEVEVIDGLKAELERRFDVPAFVELIDAFEEGGGLFWGFHGG